MTAKVLEKRIVKVECLTRVEGEGGLYVTLEGDKPGEVRLDIFEPPRMFEGFLRGRHYSEVPDITARICGICPVAYQMSAVHALEAAMGVVITPEIRQLRRLLYCAEWIESHALHMFLLQAPDFLHYESAIALAQDQPELVTRGLRLKKAGNTLLEILGGRASHPVSACVGGFYRVPRKSELMALRDELAWAREAAIETTATVSTFDFPDFEVDYEFVSVSHPDEFPMNERRIASSSGLDLEPAEYEKHFLEEHVSHSTALHSVDASTGGSYFVGPLARVNLNFDRLTPTAQAAAIASGVKWPCRNPFKGIVARGVELIHACDEAVEIIDRYVEPKVARVPVTPRAGEGCAATEAPRGTLYHRYRLDGDGLVEQAKIVPPTSQNLRRMEDDIRLLLPKIASRSDAEIAAMCEKLVRSYDPCISCSTHFLQVHLDRRP